MSIRSAAIVWDAKKTKGRSGVFILGGGSPKNFMLQTEPQIQEVLGLEESGHDYFLQVTDARPDTGGLSGATPQEAMTWGKVDPNQLPDTVTCYLDSTVSLPLMTVYALATACAAQAEAVDGSPGGIDEGAGGGVSEEPQEESQGVRFSTWPRSHAERGNEDRLLNDLLHVVNIRSDLRDQLLHAAELPCITDFLEEIDR